MLTWLPLLVLSAVRGHALGGSVGIPMLLDPVVHARFLFVVPLLELAQVFVEKSLRVQMRYFVDSGLIPDRQRREYKAFVADITHLRNSRIVDVTAVALAVVSSVLIRTVGNISFHDSSWQRLDTTITPAGWWYILVSVPFLYYLLLCWAWLFFLWAWFLFRVSTLDLELTPTHPDRAGGLGFLGLGDGELRTGRPGGLGMLSGSLAREIIHGGSTLDSVKYHMIIFVGIVMVILHAPLMVFTGRLARCRFRGLLDFGALIWAHDHEFDEKWIKNVGTTRESLLGHRDVSSLGSISRTSSTSTACY